ncbi:unnamed protein product [Gordionus sp. m RMFG-2023]
MIIKRCISTSIYHFQKTKNITESDPIQRLFLEKIREYTQNKQKSSKMLYDASPELEKRISDALTKLTNLYSQGQKDKDLDKFPEFTFEDPKLELIDMEK